MPNANWSNPTLTSTYTNFVSEVKNRDEDLALQFDGTTSTNLVINTIRWDSSANRWKKWNGASWAELTATYALTALTTTGNASIGGSVSGTALIPTAATVPTNGLYLPAANSVALATASTGRLFVDATGNVGIGTSAPSHRLMITAPAGAQDIFLAGQAGVSNGYQITSTGSALTHIWSTAGGERLRLTEAGNVGIGTSTPRGTVDIANNISTGGVVDSSLHFGYSSADYYGFRLISFNDPSTTPAGAFKLQRGTTSQWIDAVTVGNAGNVGIGTSSPSEALEVNGAIKAGTNASAVSLYLAANSAIRALGTASTTYLDLATEAAAHGQFVIRSSNAYNERFIITSTGNVGIGTSSPVRKLSVSNGGAEGIEFSPGITSGTNYEVHYNRATTAYVIKQTEAAQHVFNSATGEVVRIDNSGRLLVGTSAARSNFRIGVTNYEALQQVEAGSQGFQSLVGGIASAGGPYFMLAHQRSGAVGGNTAVLNNDELGVVSFHGSDGTNLVIGASVRAEVDGTPGANDMPGRLVFATTADGASSPTERLRIANNGQLSAVVPGNSTLYPGFLARAWVNFNGTGTVAIRSSGNVTSITDNGIGDYTVNLTTAMPDTNFCVAGQPAGNADLNTIAMGWTVNATGGDFTKTTSSVRLIAMRTTNNDIRDAYGCHVAIFR